MNIRKKLKEGNKFRKMTLPDDQFIYGLKSSEHEDITNIINYAYANRAEEMQLEKYKSFIHKKCTLQKRPKVVPRYISPKVEIMKKKEEEKKILNSMVHSTILPKININEKTLYKMKMFDDVKSKVAQRLKLFKTFKPLLNKSPSYKITNNIRYNKDNIEGEENVKK